MSKWTNLAGLDVDMTAMYNTDTRCILLYFFGKCLVQGSES